MISTLWRQYLRSRGRMTPFQQLQSLKTLYVRNRTVDAVQIPNNWDPEVGWVLNFSQENNCSRNQNNS